MKLRSIALLLALALLAGVAPSAIADDKAAIEEYTESLPAAESDVYPGKAKDKKRDKPKAAPQQSAPAQPQTSAPQAPSAASGQSDSGSSASGSGKTSKEKGKAKGKGSDDAKSKKPAEDKAKSAAEKDQEVLDRIASDPDLGAPPTADAKPAAQKTSADDSQSLAASVFDPGGPILWLLLVMFAVLAFGVARLGKGRAGGQAG